jgi:hypothetical protein
MPRAPDNESPPPSTHQLPNNNHNPPTASGTHLHLQHVSCRGQLDAAFFRTRPVARGRAVWYEVLPDLLVSVDVGGVSTPELTPYGEALALDFRSRHACNRAC